jgi:type VI secretion system protein ImpF
MATTNQRDRLCPPLMHAFRSAHAARDATKKIDLRDESGERIIAGRRTAGRTPITESMVRREVARDLESLMNTVALESAEDLTEFEHVRKSVLNYGLPDIVHRTIDDATVHDVKSEIEQVLTNFEPRLVRDTVHATRDSAIDANELKVRFVVQADLRCVPVDVPIEFVADMDLDGTSFAINRL